MEKNWSKKVLDVEQVCAATLLSREMFLHDSEVQTYLCHTMDAMMLKITRRVLCEGIAEIKHPEDWWQAFKERWLPARLQRRWPVKYKKFDIKRLYPDMVLPAPLGRSFAIVKEEDLVRSG